MSVTLTTGVAAALASGAVAAGAIGLGALGLAAAAGLKKRRRRGKHHGHRYRRHAASKSDQNATENIIIPKNASHPKTNRAKLKKKFNRQMESDEDLLLQAIKTSDLDGCGYKLVCELSAKDVNALTKDEWEILRFVYEGDRNVEQGSGILPNNTELVSYQAASRLGSSGYACGDIFRRCAVSADQIMQLVAMLL
ncbi:uncharacterized protein LOC108666148 [Hyalella azteca]|uniref:Uncharacterized protein LOC108666148 n=1 Tax=Hyalella azteca TaxID=294128 RepID=A0A8B7N5B1_HYAAZ|nr:uncharacterized protein LOC108666148 [Hyalella azteca]